MIRGPRAWRALLVLLSFGTNENAARAEEQLRTSAALTLPEAVRTAQTSAPDVLVSAARASTARSEIGVAGIITSPRVTVGSTAESAVLVSSLFISLPVFGQRGASIHAAEALAAASRAGVDVTRLDARLAVTVAWVAMWLAEHEAEIAREVAARRERLLDIARIRLNAGAGSRLDVLRSETEARRARADADARREDIDAARARLCPLVGRDPFTSQFAVAGDPPFASALPTAASLESLVETHPVTLRARASLHGADAIVARERRLRWPVLGVQFGASLANRLPPPTNDYSAALSFDIPIFSGPLVTRAESQRAEAGSELSSAVAILRGRVMSARAEYLAADRRYGAAVREVLPAAREAADLATEGYRSGGLDLTATLAVEQALADARLAAVRAQADRGRAYAALEHGAGRAL